MSGLEYVLDEYAESDGVLFFRSEALVRMRFEPDSGRCWIHGPIYGSNHMPFRIDFEMTP